MMKIISIIFFLFSPIFSEQESVLNNFEESLKNKPSNSSESESSSNESESNQSNQNSYNTNCSQSHCNSQCTYYHNKKERMSLSDKIGRFFDMSESVYKIIVKPVITVVTAPVWVAVEMDEYADKRLFFDKYPFYSTNGMYKKDGRNHYTKALISSFSFDDSVYGNMIKINYQFSGKSGINYSYIHLKENINSQNINKYMNNFMFNKIFSVNTSFLNNQAIDFSIGIGYSNWKSSEYDSSGLKLEYGIKTFVNPFSLNCNLGYSYIGNGIYDISAGISYHYKRYSFNLGLQNYKTDSTKIGGTTYSISYWF